MILFFLIKIFSQTKLKFIHVGASGVVSHVFSVDKCEVVAALPASNDVNVVSINGESQNDGVDWDVFFKKSQAILFGKVVRSGGNFKFRDQADNVDLIDYDVSATGRIVN